MLFVLYCFISLLTASAVDGFAAWQPNCTLPSQHVNFMSSPQVRGTMDIIWTCFALLLLCTWTIQHLMVPAQKDHTEVSVIRKLLGKVHFNYQKLKWMGLCIGGPEYVLGKALTEYLAANDSRRQFQEWLKTQELDSKVAGHTDKPVDEIWTTAHAFFANMRGFVLRFDVAAVPTSLEPSKPTALGRSRQNPRLVTRDGDPPYYHQEAKTAEATELQHCREICGVPCRNRPDVPSTKDSKNPTSPSPDTPPEYIEPRSDAGQRKVRIDAPERPHGAAVDKEKDCEPLKLQTDQISPVNYSPSEATAITLVESPRYPRRDISHDVVTGLMPSTYALSPLVLGRMSAQHVASPGNHQPRSLLPEREKLGPHKAWKGSWPLSTIQLLYACQKGIIPGPPELSTAALEDRSKGDIFVKGAAILQLTWLIIQMIARGSEGLAISLLEITTLAYAVCSIVTYILLWHKPQDVMTPTYIDATNVLTREHVTGLAARSPVSTLFVKEFWLHGVAIRAMADNVFPWTRGIPIRVPWKKDTFYLNPVFIGIGFGGTLFGTVHFIAWNFDFPTQIERILWRSSCCVMISIPLLSTGMYFITLHNARKDSDSDARTNVLLRPFMWLSTAVYLLARLYLMVEIFRSLASAPPSTFQAINWPSAIPHVN